MSNNLAGPLPSRSGVRSMITVTNLSPLRVCRHTCSSTPIVVTPSKRCSSLMRTLRPSSRTEVLAQSQDTPRPSATRATVRCWTTMPATGPTQSAPGQFRARLGRPSGVLPPHTPTPRTAVATHSHHQCHRSPARGLVGEATDHGVAGDPFAPTLATPPVIVHHPAGHLAAIREDSLAHHHEAEVIQAGERGQIGGSKGSVGHVGVFQMGSVGTPIIGRPRPSHPPRHASQTQPPRYTPYREEPLNRAVCPSRVGQRRGWTAGGGPEDPPPDCRAAIR
ncbi:Hypothetical protein PFR_JS7-2_2326 [Propionibacterium freudenreichii]|nr:Hypothetical protein PFR_JS7-1_2383 [Propionibacterium freudenreichii]SCQ55908.1 Hypothetical protein PFR_JS7-2_2326 [Propionibacterium freudenreichii]